MPPLKQGEARGPGCLRGPSAGWQLGGPVQRPQVKARPDAGLPYKCAATVAEGTCHQQGIRRQSEGVPCRGLLIPTDCVEWALGPESGMKGGFPGAGARGGGTPLPQMHLRGHQGLGLRREFRGTAWWAAPGEARETFLRPQGPCCPPASAREGGCPTAGLAPSQRPLVSLIPGSPCATDLTNSVTSPGLNTFGLRVCLAL